MVIIHTQFYFVEFQVSDLPFSIFIVISSQNVVPEEQHQPLLRPCLKYSLRPHTKHAESRTGGATSNTLRNKPFRQF